MQWTDIFCSLLALGWRNTVITCQCNRENEASQLELNSPVAMTPVALSGQGLAMPGWLIRVFFPLFSAVGIKWTFAPCLACLPSKGCSPIWVVVMNIQNHYSFSSKLLSLKVILLQICATTVMWGQQGKASQSKHIPGPLLVLWPLTHCLEVGSR